MIRLAQYCEKGDGKVKDEKLVCELCIRVMRLYFAHAQIAPPQCYRYGR